MEHLEKKNLIISSLYKYTCARRPIFAHARHAWPQ